MLGAALASSGCRSSSDYKQHTEIHKKHHVFGCTASARGMCNFILYNLENPPHKTPKRVLKRFTLRVGERLDVARIVGMPDAVGVCLAAQPDQSLDRCLVDGAGETPAISESRQTVDVSLTYSPPVWFTSLASENPPPP